MRARSGSDRIVAALIVAEFDQGSTIVQQFDDGTNLSSRKAGLRPVGKQGHGIEQRRSRILFVFFLDHHSTQQVTKRGTSSPLRTIQTVLTMTLRSCRATSASTCQRVPKAS